MESGYERKLSRQGISEYVSFSTSLNVVLHLIDLSSFECVELESKIKNIPLKSEVILGKAGVIFS